MARPPWPPRLCRHRPSGCCSTPSPPRHPSECLASSECHAPGFSGSRTRIGRNTRMGRSVGSLSGLGRHLDLAVDDLLLVVVELGLDVVEEAARRGVVDAAGLEVEDLLAALP